MSQNSVNNNLNNEFDTEINQNMVALQQRRKQASSKEDQKKTMRSLNTAFIAEHRDSQEYLQKELEAVMASPAYQCLLDAVQRLSIEKGIDENEASRELVKTFKKLDTLWNKLLIQKSLSSF